MRARPSCVYSHKRVVLRVFSRSSARARRSCVCSHDRARVPVGLACVLTSVRGRFCVCSRERAWPSWVGSHGRAWPSCVCSHERASPSSCDAACVSSCVRAVPPILRTSAFDFWSVSCRYINKVFLNNYRNQYAYTYLFMSLMNGNTIACIYVVIRVYLIVYVISMVWSIPYYTKH